jgi:hypothetical protein
MTRVQLRKPGYSEFRPGYFRPEKLLYPLLQLFEDAYDDIIHLNSSFSKKYFN